MEISFDPEKRRRTLERRGLDFADAGMVFAGPVIEFEDVRFVYPERRFATYGLLDGRMVALVWTEAANGRRVISMRKANERERAHYGPRLARPGG
ncbi:BrnT family toxin [Sphingomonas sp. DT-51]|uniref:BrnT family toxin n=1 Tax=Sphingomonas sp. DT-51 TaxID=3396165 RepID=UPI003F1B5D40